MARINTPSPSEDDFEILDDFAHMRLAGEGGQQGGHTQSQSQSQSHREQVSPVQGDHGAANLDRLSGPHEVPVVPQSTGPDDIYSASEHISEPYVGEEHRSSSTDQHKSDGTKSRGNFMTDGVQYTKSVYNKLWSKDALIAVMGMTGSGKTTFISKVTGRSDLRIGHDLTSCTRDIQVIETQIDGQTVRFVDTPGFSDTNLSDTEILQLIADYLAVAYKQEMKLSGIIYLHPISDNRFTHHATKNLDMFRKLTGEENLKNVVLATSMWDKVSEAEGARHQEDLRGNFWKLLVAMGARTARHDDTAASARAIAQGLLANKRAFYLQLQEEMGKDNLALRDTAAGREVMLEIARLKDEHQRELAEMEGLIRSSARESEGVIEALRDHYQGRLADLERTLRDERGMSEEAVRSLTDRIQALERRGPGCVVM